MWGERRAEDAAPVPDFIIQVQRHGGETASAPPSRQSSWSPSVCARSCRSVHTTPHHKEVKIIMSHETAGNATARGPPPIAERATPAGGEFRPQFTIIHHTSWAAAAVGRSGTFPGRPVFVAADPAQPSNHNRKNNKR